MRRLVVAGLLVLTSCAAAPTLSTEIPRTFDLGAGVTARIDYLEVAGDPILTVLMSASTPWGSMPVAVDGRPDVEAVLRLESGAEIRGVDGSKGFPAWGGSVLWQSSVRFRFEGGDAGDPPRILHLRLYEWEGTFEIETAGRLTRVVRRVLAIGEDIHVDLEHDRIEVDVKINVEPSTLTLILDVEVPGWESDDWDEDDLKLTMGYQGGGESGGFALDPGFSSWVGCLHRFKTKVIASFPKEVGGGEARSLEVRIGASRLLFRIAGR